MSTVLVVGVAKKKRNTTNVGHISHVHISVHINLQLYMSTVLVVGVAEVKRNANDAGQVYAPYLERLAWCAGVSPNPLPLNPYPFPLAKKPLTHNPNPTNPNP